MKLRYIIWDRPGAHLHTARPELGGWRGRCTYCGHRVGPNVIETRRQWWRIPSEIVMRFRAMRREI